MSYSIKTFENWLNRIFAFASLMAIVLTLMRFGFPLSVDEKIWLTFATEVVLVIFIVHEIMRSITVQSTIWAYVKSRKLEILMFVFAVQYFVGINFIQNLFKELVPNIEAHKVSLIYLAISQMGLIAVNFLGQSKKYRWFQKLKVDPSQVISLSFLGGASLGTMLLKLPKATYEPISWVDALFTAMSSICVTGLLPFNLAETFTPLGQFIIAVLVQIGGLGIMTLTMVFLTLFPGSLSVKEKIFLSEMVSESRLGEVSGIIRRIVITTFTIEAIGAIYLYLNLRGFSQAFDVKTFYHSIFHSISAFCNAGMTLFKGNYDFMGVNGFTSGLAILIIMGGIGFPVITDLIAGVQNRLDKGSIRRHRLSLTTKIVLVASICLWIVGFAIVYLLESNHSFAALGEFEKIFHSLFFSITTRTAGFSSWDLATLNGATIIFLMMMMWVGASPTSTGGGIKTINLALIILSLKSHIQGNSRVNIFQREISPISILRSFNIVTLTMLISAISMILLFYIEPGLNPLHLAFEVVSALGTVGLSINLTDDLSSSGKVLIVLLMFLGRVGPYAFLLGIYRKQKSVYHKELTENIQTF